MILEPHLIDLKLRKSFLLWTAGKFQPGFISFQNPHGDFVFEIIDICDKIKMNEEVINRYHKFLFALYLHSVYASFRVGNQRMVALPSLIHFA